MTDTARIQLLSLLGGATSGILGGMLVCTVRRDEFGHAYEGLGMGLSMGGAFLGGVLGGILSARAAHLGASVLAMAVATLLLTLPLGAAVGWVVGDGVLPMEPEDKPWLRLKGAAEGAGFGLLTGVVVLGQWTLTRKRHASPSGETGQHEQERVDGRPGD